MHRTLILAKFAASRSPLGDRARPFDLKTSVRQIDTLFPFYSGLSNSIPQGIFLCLDVGTGGTISFQCVEIELSFSGASESVKRVILKIISITSNHRAEEKSNIA